MFKKVFKTQASILIMMLLLGCSLEQKQVSAIDKIQPLMLSQNCTAPCWVGIQVGFTEFDNAKSILQDRYGFDYVKVESNYLEWSHEISPNDGVKSGSVLFSVDGKVNDIFLILDENSNFLVKDLFEILGEPSWVDTNWGGPVQSEKPCFSIALEFPNKGVWADLDSRNESKGVGENQLVSILRFMPIPDTEKWQVYDFASLKWSGYKDYCQIVVDSIP